MQRDALTGGSGLEANASPHQYAARRLLSMDEASQYLDIAKSTLYTMVSQRRVPFVKVGRLTKFDVRALEAWIGKHSVAPLKLPLVSLPPAA